MRISKALQKIQCEEPAVREAYLRWGCESCQFRNLKVENVLTDPEEFTSYIIDKLTSFQNWEFSHLLDPIAEEIRHG